MLQKELGLCPGSRDFSASEEGIASSRRFERYMPPKAIAVTAREIFRRVLAGKTVQKVSYANTNDRKYDIPA